jgi:hypothetical protein
MTIDAELTALGKTAPRVTIEEIEANIASEHYFTAADGVAGAASLAHRTVVTGEGGEPLPTLSLLTFCVLVMKNGFTVTGESACASPENFDADIGRKVARGAAIGKCWPLLGFRLRDRLVAEDYAPDHHDAAEN